MNKKIIINNKLLGILVTWKPLTNVFENTLKTLFKIFKHSAKDFHEDTWGPLQDISEIL